MSSCRVFQIVMGEDVFMAGKACVASTMPRPAGLLARKQCSRGAMRMLEQTFRHLWGPHALKLVGPSQYAEPMMQSCVCVIVIGKLMTT